jgi:hypothetical protein
VVKRLTACSFVREFGELPEEFLEHIAHKRVVHAVRVRVDVGELLSDRIGQT